jgi:hypothetical protein
MSEATARSGSKAGSADVPALAVLYFIMARGLQSACSQGGEDVR